MDIILRKSRLLSNHQLDRLHHNVNVAILFTNGIPFFTFRMFSFSSKFLLLAEFKEVLGLLGIHGGGHHVVVGDSLELFAQIRLQFVKI